MALNVKEDEENEENKTQQGNVEVDDIESGDSLGEEPEPEPEPEPTLKLFLFAQGYAVCSYDTPTVLKNPVFKCELSDWFANDKLIRKVSEQYVLGKPDEQDVKNNEAYHALEQKIAEEQKFLSDTDYVCFEIIEGAAKKDDKQKVLDERVSTREQMVKDKDTIAQMKLVDLGTEVQCKWIDNKGNPAEEPMEPADEKEVK